MLGEPISGHVDPPPLAADCGVVTILEATSCANVVVAVTATGVHCSLKSPIWFTGYLSKVTVVTYFNAKVVSDGGGCLIDCDHDGAVLVPHVTGAGKVAEGFAGIGGWSHGLHQLGCAATMAVECDLETAQAYGKIFQAEVFFTAEAVQMLKLGTFRSTRFIIVGDMKDKAVWMIAGCVGISTWLISPPCQPWSSSGMCLGLQVPDGEIFVEVLQIAGQCGVQSILAENVPNLVKHQDFVRLKEEATQAGFQLVIDTTDDVGQFLPCRRKRWLGIFIRHSLVSSLSCPGVIRHFQWPAVSSLPVGVKMSLERADSIHVNLTEVEVTELMPSEYLWKLMMDPDLLPPWLRKPELSHEDMLCLRVVKGDGVFKAIMASYGSQDNIPMHCLKKSGLHAFVVPLHPDQPDQFRLASPWEFLSAMGFPSTTVLPRTQFKAWRVAGNALAPSQAALSCFRLSKLLGLNSPIVPINGEPEVIVASLAQPSMPLSKLVEHRDGNWRWLEPLDKPSVPVTCIDDDGYGSDGFPPTVPFQIDDDSLRAEVVLFAEGQQVPDLEDVMRRFLLERGTLMHKQFNHIPWVVAHAHGHSVFAGWAMSHQTILQVIQLVWPHVKVNEMINVVVNGQAMNPLGYIEYKGDSVRITVNLQAVAVKVSVESHHESYKVSIDPSWTAADLKAYIGVRVGLLPSQLTVAFNDIHVEDDEFLWDWSTDAFTIKLDPKFNHKLQLVRRVFIPNEVPQHSDKCDPNSNGQTRFSIRHPVWSTVRSTTGHPELPLRQLLSLLFPDFQTDSLEVTADGLALSLDCTVQHIPPSSELWVFFSSGSRIPMQQLHRQLPFAPMSLSEVKTLTERWTRSPFSHRASPQSIPGCWTLAQLAGSFLLTTTSCQKLLCLVNGKHVDPRMRVMDVTEDLVISVRPCALPGGCPEPQPVEFGCHQDCGVSAATVQIALANPVNSAIHVATVHSDDKVIDAFARVMPRFHVHGLLSQCGVPVSPHVTFTQLNMENHAAVYVIMDEGISCCAFAACHGKSTHLETVEPFYNHTSVIDAADHNLVLQLAIQTIPKCSRVIVCTALQNGEMLQPLMQIHDLSSDCPVRFKLAQLPGFVKNELRNKVRASLISHGVPDSAADARVTSVLQGVPSEKLRQHESEDLESFWTSLKQLASDNKIRLVTAVELRDLQKLKRANARVNPPGPSKGQKPDGKVQHHIPPVDDLQFSAHHFVADDETVPLLSKDRFGPDAHGLAIMSVDEASSHATRGCISMDALAILAIGHRAASLGPKLLVPAHGKDGAPLLVPGALLQFGETHVEFKAALPAAETVTIDAITMEFTLRREFISQWEATATPMHFLGVQCPELRGSGRILSSWAIKAYKNRKPVAYSQAEVWHGYLKLEAKLADSLLRRSGQHGMFFTPRGQDKKPDPRYSVIPFPGRSVDAIKELSQEVDKVLGIAVLGSSFQNFGIRCRKIDFDDLKKRFFPESVQVDAAVVNPEDQLWTINYLTAQFTRESMDTALQMVQWDARAIKSTGPSSWLVASPSPPPSDHLCINGALAVVSAKRVASGPTMVVTRADVVTQVGQPDGSCITQRSRFDQIQADIQDHVKTLVDAQLGQTSAQIQQLTAALDDTKLQLQQAQEVASKQFDQLQRDQCAALQRVSDVETSMNAHTGTILQQMKAMITSFNEDNGKRMETIQGTIRGQITGLQSDLSARIDSIEREQIKRVKLNEP